MKKISIYSFLIGCLCLCLMTSPILHAQTTRQEDKAAIEMQINQLVDELRQTREQSVELNKSIFDYQEKLKVINQKIDNLNAVVEKRKQQSLERLRDIQLNDEVNMFLQLLFTSNSITDFIQRAILLSQLQDEANSRLYLAQQTIDELNQLKTEQELLLSNVMQKQALLEHDMLAIEQKRQELETIIAQYPDVVEEIIVKKEQEANSHNIVSQQTANIADTQSTTTSINVVQEQESTSASQQNEAIKEIEKPVNVALPIMYSINEFKRRGAIVYNGNKFTYYSELVLPGTGLNIPGRHVNAQGYVVDGEGYIVLANNAPIGTIVETPFGSLGKVYDRGTYGNHYDVYLR